MNNTFDSSDEFRYFDDVRNAINSNAQKIFLCHYVAEDSTQQLADRECIGASIYANYADNRVDLDKALQSLSQLHNLKRLDIDTIYPFNESILSQMQSLEYLSIKSQVAQPILSLPNLRFLDLDGIPDLSPEMYQIPTLEVLRLTCTNLSDHDFSGLPKLQHLQYLNLNSTKIRQLPEEIIKLPQLQSIDFRHNPISDWDETFKILAQLKQMQSLDLSNYNLKSLSDNIGLLSQIRQLDLISNQLTALPVGLQQLTQLEVLLYDHADIPIDNQLEILAHIPLIQSFYLSQMADKISFKALSGSIGLLQKLTQSEELLKDQANIFIDNQLEILAHMPLYLSKMSDKIDQLSHLIDHVLHITGLEKDFNALSQLSDIQRLTIHCHQLPLPESLFNTIKDLPLQTLSLYDSLVTNDYLKQLLPQIASISNLQNLKIPLTYDLPEDMHLLKGLKKIHINFISMNQNIELPSSMVAFDQTTFTSEPPKMFDNLNHYIKNFGKADLEEGQKKLAFAIITDQRKLLDEFIPDPFGEDLDPSQCVFFLAGRTEGMTQKEIKEKLKEQGIKVATKLHKKVTHVLVGRLVKNSLIDTILQRPELHLTLEDHLKDFFIAQEQPFLLEEDADPLNENVMEMLFNEDNTNVQLALTMLEDGGANTKIITAVMLLSLYHNDKDVRKDARKIYKKYASASLQNHVKANKPSEIFLLNAYKTIYQHPEIDREVFLVMHARVRAYFDIPSDWGLKCLPSETRYLSSLSCVDFSNLSDFDFSASFQLLQKNNLERITINNCNLKCIPTEIFDFFPNIEYLELDDNDISEIPKEILKLTKLSSIDLYDNPIEAVPEFLTQLKEIFSVSINAKHLKTEIPEALEGIVEIW